MSLYVEGDVPYCGSNNNSNNGWNDWSWIIGLALVGGLFGGWGNGGAFGGVGNGGGRGGFGYPYGGGYVTNDELQMGFFRNDVSDKLDGINYGIANASFSLNNTMTNGFAGVQQSLCQGFSGINTALVQQGYESRLGTQALAHDLSKCCCDIREGISGVNYNLATQFGNLNNTLCGLGRDIIENANANYRAIHEELVANKIEAKNERIAELTAQLQRADLQASQQAQNAYLLNELKPCAKPSFVVQPPQPVTFPTNCCGNVSYANFGGNGCGCGC